MNFDQTPNYMKKQTTFFLIDYLAYQRILYVSNSLIIYTIWVTAQMLHWWRNIHWGSKIQQLPSFYIINDSYSGSGSSSFINKPSFTRSSSDIKSVLPQFASWKWAFATVFIILFQTRSTWNLDAMWKSGSSVTNDRVRPQF